MKVAVVGAGFAGLAAARELVRHGADMVVLEARGRVGGRVVNHRFPDGVTVELGGQWVGPTQDHILSLIAELGIETFPSYDAGDSLISLDGRVRRFKGSTYGLPPHVLAEAAVTQKRLERMAGSVPLNAPWTAERATRWDGQTLETWLLRNLRFDKSRRFWRGICVAILAAEPSEVSLLHFLFYCASGGMLERLMNTTDGAQEQRVVGGTQVVAEAMAGELDGRMRLEEAVRSIEQGANGVRVSTAQNSYECDAVIVAIPPHLVSGIEFDPPTPSARTQLAQSMPMGSVIKCVVRYPSAFWRDDGLSGFAVSDDHLLTPVFDNSPPDASCGLLMGFFEGANGRAASRLSSDERRAAAVSTLTTLFGAQAADPIDYAELDWSTERWTGGCFGAHFGPGGWTQLGPELRRPHGRVHWAGAETASRWNGYIDGAIASGKDAAQAVLQTIR